MTVQKKSLILYVIPAKAGIQARPAVNRLPELIEKLRKKNSRNTVDAPGEGHGITMAHHGDRRSRNDWVESGQTAREEEA